MSNYVSFGTLSIILYLIVTIQRFYKRGPGTDCYKKGFFPHCSCSSQTVESGLVVHPHSGECSYNLSTLWDEQLQLVWFRFVQDSIHRNDPAAFDIHRKFVCWQGPLLWNLRLAEWSRFVLPGKIEIYHSCCLFTCGKLSTMFSGISIHSKGSADIPVCFARECVEFPFIRCHIRF